VVLVGDERGQYAHFVIRNHEAMVGPVIHNRINIIWFVSTIETLVEIPWEKSLSSIYSLLPQCLQ
jgi:hypothetical protein